jgi:hypothetical protein
MAPLAEPIHVIDVRSLPPPQRQAPIFGAFDSLPLMLRRLDRPDAGVGQRSTP